LLTKLPISSDAFCCAPQVKQITDELIPNVDSLGLNEQELRMVAKATNGPHQHYLDDSFENPEIEIVADLVYHILKTFSSYTPNLTPGVKHDRLTRVHFHTLSYHMIGVEYGAWNHTAVSDSLRLGMHTIV
jgi:ADP-dependent glucokinase